MTPLLLLLSIEGENDPIRVLNRGVRIRGEGKVVEVLRVSGTGEVEVEGRGWEKWYATGVAAAVAVGEFGVK